jgi:hypothetical protein
MFRLKIKSIIEPLQVIKRPLLIKHQTNSIVLRSIEKSGTNYLRIMIANYLFNVVKTNNSMSYQKISYEKMHSQLFPNIRNDIFLGKQKHGNSFLKTLDEREYVDFMYDHGSFLDKLPRALMPKKMILLYRNPLDQMVSWYHYRYKDRGVNVNHPNELLDILIRYWLVRYKEIKRLDESMGSDSKSISYECLVTSPNNSLNDLIEFLGFEIYSELIDFAVQAASKKNVLKEEERKGKMIHGNPKKIERKSFIRSGKIGDWKNYFNSYDFNKIKKILEFEGIDIEEFTLE